MCLIKIFYKNLFFFTKPFLQIMDETWGYFFRRVYKKNPNCSLCYLYAFREQYCFEFLIYKCLCKSCEGEEIICRFCSQHVNEFVHLCNCGKYCERHLTRDLLGDTQYLLGDTHFV